MAHELLPWERTDGEPSGTGICLSGGGLRAASFSMGAIQALQEKLGLLYGPQPAKFLAVVSGGSYTGAAALLSAANSTTACPPLDPASPEAAHIISSGRYLIEDGARGFWRFLWRFLVSSLASALLMTWTGFIMVDVAVTLHPYRVTPSPDGA